MYQQALDKVSKQLLVRERYDNFIGGKWVAPVEGKYFDNPSPITGKRLCQVPRSTAADIELALDAAHKAKDAWGKSSVQERSRLLNKVADKLESNLELLALVETLDNGKPIRETTHADMPLVVDHWRYFASVVRAQEGGISEIDQDTVAYHFHEPLGVVGQIIPWNFPILMATWKLAPALAAGNCVVLKPAEQTPLGILVVMELIADILPPGVVNVVNGFGIEAAGPRKQRRQRRPRAVAGRDRRRPLQNEQGGTDADADKGQLRDPYSDPRLSRRSHLKSEADPTPGLICPGRRRIAARNTIRPNGRRRAR